MVLYFLEHKKITIPLRVIAICFVVIIGFSIFLWTHPTHYRFNDRWIRKNNINKVQERYGDYDLGSLDEGERGYIAYYVYTDNGPIMPDHKKYYYHIKYDEQGDVTEIYVNCSENDM